jgi:hypothetical protein
MSKLVVINDVTLDGVVRRRAGPTRTARHGFEHGGWAVTHR